MTFTVSEKRNSRFMMTVFHGLFSWSWAGLSHEFILKWSFNWVSHTNKIGDKCRRENNLSLWGNSWCHTAETLHASVASPAAVCSVDPRVNCSHLEPKSTLECTAFILPSFVNLYVSCVILREWSKAPTLHSRWHASQATKLSKVIYFLWRVKLENHVGASLRWALRRGSWERFSSNVCSVFWVTSWTVTTDKGVL